jgi:hypothetical protein
MWLFQIRILVETSPILLECVAFPWSQCVMTGLFLGASYSSFSCPFSLLRKKYLSRQCSFHECYFYHRPWGVEEGWAVITLSLPRYSCEVSHLNRHFAFGNFLLLIWRKVTSWTIQLKSSRTQYAIYKVTVISSMLKTLFLARSGPQLRHDRGFTITYNTIGNG